MDGSRFDRFAREMATGRSRRSVVKAAGAAVLGALGLAGAGRGVEAAAPCRPAAPGPRSRCAKDAQCCAGLVCQSRRCQVGCRTGGTFYASGMANPAHHGVALHALA